MSPVCIWYAVCITSTGATGSIWHRRNNMKLSCSIQQWKHSGHWSLWPAQMLHLKSCPENTIFNHRSVIELSNFYHAWTPFPPPESRLSIFWFKILSSSRISSFRANMTRLHLTKNTWTGKTRSNIHHLQIHQIAHKCVFNHVSLPGKSSTSPLNNVSTILNLVGWSQIQDAAMLHLACFLLTYRTLMGWAIMSGIHHLCNLMNKQVSNTPWHLGQNGSKWTKSELPSARWYASPFDGVPCLSLAPSA